MRDADVLATAQPADPDVTPLVSLVPLDKTLSPSHTLLEPEVERCFAEVALHREKSGSRPREGGSDVREP